MKHVIQAVKGTRDFYPEQMAVRRWLYSMMRAVSEAFGYEEYDAPMLEPFELYAAKSGDELVREQAYAFTDRGGSRITLRPELTPSLARMIAARQHELPFPLRWWSFGPFWRYERPQKGRSREFFQWNVDLIGSDSPEADAESVAVLATFFERVGLRPDHVRIYVNNRSLVESQMELLGIVESHRVEVMAWIDRRAKMTALSWQAAGTKIGLSAMQLSSLSSALEDADLWRQSEELTRFFTAIDALGLREYVQFEASVVRGLAYYTGTVFEAWEVGGEIRRSILGGGRYDKLLEDVGGETLPAVGFAMGDVVIGLLLQKHGLLPTNLAVNPASVLVTVFDQKHISDSYRLAGELRRAGVNVIVYPEAARLPKQFKHADRTGVKFVLVIGPDEVAEGQVLIKDLSTGHEEAVPRGGVVDVLAKALVR